MKWHLFVKDVQTEENEDKKLKSTIEQRYRESSEQLDLFPHENPKMLERVRIFLKDMRT